MSTDHQPHGGAELAAAWSAGAAAADLAGRLHHGAAALWGVPAAPDSRGGALMAFRGPPVLRAPTSGAGPLVGTISSFGRPMA